MYVEYIHQLYKVTTSCVFIKLFVGVIIYDVSVELPPLLYSINKVKVLNNFYFNCHVQIMCFNVTSLLESKRLCFVARQVSGKDRHVHKV